MAKVSQRTCETQGIAVCKTDDEGLLYWTYINDQRFKKQEKMLSLFKEREIKNPTKMKLCRQTGDTLLIPSEEELESAASGILNGCRIVAFLQVMLW